MLAPGLERQLGRLMPAFFAQLATIPLAAQLACAPLLIALNPHISMWGVVANMLAAPVVAVVTYTGLAATALGALLPSLAQPLVLPALWGCAWLECIAHFFCAPARRPNELAGETEWRLLPGRFKHGHLAAVGSDATLVATLDHGRFTLSPTFTR